MTATPQQRERLGMLARRAPWAVMNAPRQRIIGPVAIAHDRLIWAMTIGQNRYQGHIRVWLEHSDDGTAWQSFDPPLRHETTGNDESITIMMTRTEDMTGDMRFIRAVVTGTFTENWHHAGMEVTCRHG